MKITREFEEKTLEFIGNTRQCNKYKMIVLIESNFRPFSMRMLEYFLFTVLLVVSPTKALQMTIGVNQLKVVHWLSYLRRKKIETNLLKLVFACENIDKATKATKMFLESNSFKFDSGEKISVVYTGQYNSYYELLFSFACSKLRK